VSYGPSFSLAHVPIHKLRTWAVGIGLVLGLLILFVLPLLLLGRKDKTHNSDTVAKTLNPQSESSGSDAPIPSPETDTAGTPRPTSDAGFDDNDGLKSLGWLMRVRMELLQTINDKPGNQFVARDAWEKYANALQKPIGHRVKWGARIAAICNDYNVFLDPIGEINPPDKDRMDGINHLMDGRNPKNVYTWRTKVGLCIFRHSTQPFEDRSWIHVPYLTNIPVADGRAKIKSLRIGMECVVSGTIAVFHDPIESIVHGRYRDPNRPFGTEFEIHFPGEIIDHQGYPFDHIYRTDMLAHGKQFEDVWVGLKDANVTVP
jgi:hypothetical protein